MSEITDGLLIISSDYTVVYASPLFSQLGELQGDAIQDALCYQLLRQREHPCEETSSPCPLRKVIKTGKQFTSYQTYFNAKKEEGVVYLNRTAPFSFSPERIYRFRGPGHRKQCLQNSSITLYSRIIVRA